MRTLIIGIPGLLLCGFIWLLPVEKPPNGIEHLGYQYPGINTQIAYLSAIVSAVVIVYALIALVVKHNSKLDFVFQYAALFLAVIKLYKTIELFSGYYDVYYHHLLN
jgi:hypothetical protein